MTAEIYKMHIQEIGKRFDLVDRNKKDFCMISCQTQLLTANKCALIHNDLLVQKSSKNYSGIRDAKKDWHKKMN